MTNESTQMSDKARLASALQTIAGIVQSWIDWSDKVHAEDGTRTHGGTHIMTVPTPTWPTHSAMGNWIAALNDAAARLSASPVGGVDRDNVSVPRGYLSLIADLLEECDNHIPCTGTNFDDDFALARKTTRAYLVAAPQPVAWQNMDSAPKDGTRILIDFGRVGIHAVSWEESVSGTIGWCVDDEKHGPYPLRRYVMEDICGWMPLPAALHHKGNGE